MCCMYLCIVAKDIFPNQSVCKLGIIEDFLAHGNLKYDEVVKAKVVLMIIQLHIHIM